MTNDKFHPRLCFFAWSEVCVALVTLTFGALTTTKGAGMAFPDWPTSDGYLMVTYPWLKDFAVDWNKFLEHGHRLAGMWIGIWSIGLAAYTWKVESRSWVKGLSLSILLGVICQGLLGGFRVQLNERGLAMLHGMFAAVVFSLMGMLVVVTGKGWRRADSTPGTPAVFGLRWLSAVFLAVLVLQYVLGSLIRHQGMALHEHRGLGILAALLSLALLPGAWSTKVRWLRRSAVVLCSVVWAQVALGFSTWIHKYGMASIGYVAIMDSPAQVILRSAHMVWGALTIMLTVLFLARVWRVASVTPVVPRPQVPIRAAAPANVEGC